VPARNGNFAERLAIDEKSTKMFDRPGDIRISLLAGNHQRRLIADIKDVHLRPGLHQINIKNRELLYLET